MLNYEIIKKLGKGSFGSVLLVKEKSSGRFLALKKVSLENQDLNNYKFNPITEVELLSSLDSEYIIKYYKCFTENQKLYIVMEYADDGDLSGQVKEAKQTGLLIKETKIRKWLAQLCSALNELTDKNILHRDIKLQNVFLTKSDIIKLGDFGISKRLLLPDELTNTNLGTPYYYSPELCLGKGYGHKTDIWMLGCLLYELCALEKPFNSQNISIIVNKILYEEPHPISDIYSDFLRNLLEKLLDKNQYTRPDIKTIMNMPEIKLEILKTKKKLSKPKSLILFSHNESIIPNLNDNDKSIMKNLEKSSIFNLVKKIKNLNSIQNNSPMIKSDVLIHKSNSIKQNFENFVNDRLLNNEEFKEVKISGIFNFKSRKERENKNLQSQFQFFQQNRKNRILQFSNAMKERLSPTYKKNARSVSASKFKQRENIILERNPRSSRKF